MGDDVTLICCNCNIYTVKIFFLEVSGFVVCYKWVQVKKSYIKNVLKPSKRKNNNEMLT